MSASLQMKRLVVSVSMAVGIAATGISAPRVPDIPATTAVSSDDAVQSEVACAWYDSTTTIHGSGQSIRVLQNVSTQEGTGELRSLHVDESGVLRSAIWRASNGIQDASSTSSDDAPRARLVGSAPVIVGTPAARHFDEAASRSYELFSRAQRDRPEMIYAISVEGMLTGYGAAAGRQVSLAFESSGPATSQNEEGLASAYLAVADVFLAGEWRSVAVGTNGRTVFAVDVTTPQALEKAASSRRALLWEFDERPPGMASPRTFTQPVVAKLRTDTWAAIFGVDAALYVLDIASGDVIRTFDIPEEAGDSVSLMPNVIAAPAAVNVWPGDAIEYVYAGDRQGRLWKFDLTAPSAEQWHIALDAQPLFQARDSTGRPQPIVTRPEVIRGSQGTEVIVSFGAGSQAWPSASGATFYGVVDRGRTVLARSAMQRLQMVNQAPPGTDAATTRHIAVDETKTTSADPQGWYLDLPAETGEAFATDPVVRNSKLIFATQEADASSCRQGSLWTFVMDVSRSSQPNRALPSAESEGSGETVAGSAVATRGYRALKLGPPPIAQTVDVQGRCMLRIYAATARPGDAPVVASCDDQTQGRQSWRQLR